MPGGPQTPPKVSQKQPNPLVSITEEQKTSLLFSCDNFIFWCLLVIFHQYPTLAGGLNTTPRAPYWAISLSYDNRRKNLSTVWWFSRIFENHRALLNTVSLASLNEMVQKKMESKIHIKEGSPTIVWQYKLNWDLKSTIKYLLLYILMILEFFSNRINVLSLYTEGFVFHNIWFFVNW